MAPYGFPAVGCDGTVAGYAPAKTKRRDLEDVYDEFSLSAPARKIRRLDAELAPIMEEEVPVPRIFGQSLAEEQMQSCSLADGLAAVEVDPPLALNEERAIVPYNPPMLADFPSSPNVFLKVDPDVIAGLKNRRLWSGKFNMVDVRDEERETCSDDGQASSSSCLAMVPWVPAQPSGAAFPFGVPGGTSEVAEETMLSEDVEPVSMDVEEEGDQPSGVAAQGMVMTEGSQHWQQTRQISTSNPGPIMCSW